MPALTKHAVRFLLDGEIITVICADLGKADAICQALDHLETGGVEVNDVGTVSIIVKAYPAGEVLADPKLGRVIDTTPPYVLPERVAA